MLSTTNLRPTIKHRINTISSSDSCNYRASDGTACQLVHHKSYPQNGITIFIYQQKTKVQSVPKRRMINKRYGDSEHACPARIQLFQNAYSRNDALVQV